MEIKRCASREDFILARQLTEDYLAWLAIDLSFQDVERELADFSSVYGPQVGLFLLALHQGEVAGGVGLRRLEAGICEMKRLFVYDRFKGKGVGRFLCEALIREAEVMGYERMRLDTLERLEAAVGLYRSLGFEEIEAYRFNPDKTTRYMELRLR